MDPGYTEATYSRNETIGMPNWSFISLTGSVHTTCPTEHYDATYEYLFQVVEAFLKERIEGVARALNIWGKIETTILPEQVKAMIVPPCELRGSECMFSTKETVGLANKAKIEIFASSKKGAASGHELTQLERAAFEVQHQMKGKRDLVLANPRPWIENPS